MSLALADLDELVLSVRDRTSLTYVQEALAAYRTGAYRSAIVAMWIAVTYDVFTKIRELGGQGDASAQGFVKGLDSAIEAASKGNTQTMQKLESSVLEVARDSFQLLSPREYGDLDRLRVDRHMCAHPAFVSEESLFSPSAELVRVHIVHAVRHLLAQAPTQGRSALGRIKQDILQPSFPKAQDAAAAFLEEKYFRRAKSSLLASVVSVCLKTIIRRDDADLVGHEPSVLRCLAAVKYAHEPIYAEQLARDLPRLTDGLPDPALARVFLIASADPACWKTLSGPTRSKLIAIAHAHTFGVDDDGVVVNALAISELRASIIAALSKADVLVQAHVIARYPRPELADMAIAVFSAATGWRHAESLGQDVLLPHACFLSPSQIEQVLSSVMNNGQIWDAGGIDAILAAFYSKVSAYALQSQEKWRELLVFGEKKAGGDLGSYRAFPALRKRLARDGIVS